jgi:hypothetical protein
MNLVDLAGLILKSRSKPESKFEDWLMRSILMALYVLILCLIACAGKYLAKG